MASRRPGVRKGSTPISDQSGTGLEGKGKGKGKGKGNNRGGRRPNAGRPTGATTGARRSDPVITIPQHAERTQPVRGGEDKEAVHIRALQHNASAGQDAIIIHQASRARGAERREEKVRAELAESELTVSRLRGEVAAATAACAEAVANVKAGASHPTRPTPSPAPEPELRPYNSDTSKKRAVRKLRSFLQLYPADSQADLVARAIVVDGRGSEVRVVGEYSKGVVK